jgi:hypothetical protein
MPLAGTFDTLSFLELLQVVQQNQVSGVLTVSTGLEEIRVGLRRGEVVAVGSDGPGRLELGQALLARGLLDPARLQAALEAAPRAGSVRAALVADAGLGERALVEIEAELAFELLLGLFFREEGSFHLSTEGEPDLDRVLALPHALLLPRALRTQSLLFEALARQDEWREIRLVFPTGHIRIEARPGVETSPLPAARRLAELGRPATIAELCARLGGGRFEICRQLYQAHRAGLVRVLAEADPGQGLQFVEDSLERARALLAGRRFGEAQATLAATVELDPDCEPARELLAEARRVELEHLRARLPAHRVPVLVVPSDGLAGRGLDPRELYLAMQLQGRQDVASLAESTALGELELLRLLEKLLDANLARI